MEPGSSTRSLWFAGKSVIFNLVVFLLMLSLLSVLGSVCLEGRDVALLVPVQVDAVNMKKPEFVRIRFEGFFFSLVLEHIHVFPTNSSLDLGCSDDSAKFSSRRGYLSRPIAVTDVRRLCPDRCFSGDLEPKQGWGSEAQQTWESLQHGSDWVCLAQAAFEPPGCTTWADQHKPDPAQASGVVVPMLMPGAPHMSIRELTINQTQEANRDMEKIYRMPQKGSG